jgi:hypothetical protein
MPRAAPAFSSVARAVAWAALGLLLAVGTGPDPATAQGAPADSTAREISFSSSDVAVAESLRTRVLVLGTPHLTRIGPRFRPVMVNRLVDVLEAYDPSAVAVEALPPSAIASMQQRAAYDSLVQRFAGPQLRYGKRAQAALGLSADAAGARADSLLHHLEGATASLPPAQRLDLVQTLLAAYRIHSAALQWSYLSDSTRQAQTVVADTTVQYFRYRRIRAHEIDAVGIRLARRLDLPQVVPIDDHREKDLLVGIEQPLRRSLPVDSLLALQAFTARIRDHRRRAVARGDLLPFYRRINRDAFLEAGVRRQWLLYYRTRLKSRLDRTRAALWETRNLLMTAHIRRLTAHHPGERILVLVGASHKPFLDAMLNASIGIQRVDLSDVIDRVGLPPPLPDPSGQR